MNSSDYISLLALLVAIIFSYTNYRYTKRQFQIAVTPILVSRLSLTKSYNKAQYVVVSQKKGEEKRLFYHNPTDLTLRMKNLSNTLAITGIKWKVEYAEQRKWWFPITSWINAPMFASIPSELDPLDEKIFKLFSWDDLATSILPNSIEEITKPDTDGKAHKYFIAKTPISITIRLTLSYKAGIPNAEYVTLRQIYYINLIQSDTLTGIIWTISNDDTMIENPTRVRSRKS